MSEVGFNMIIKSSTTIIIIIMWFKIKILLIKPCFSNCKQSEHSSVFNGKNVCDIYIYTYIYVYIYISGLFQAVRCAVNVLNVSMCI